MTKSLMEGEEQTIAVSVPLFLRKLWKMVNDQEAEPIIGWNSTGDGFIIYDQFQFVTKLLPKYFKHSNMSSFVRQLNFYDFHKVSSIDKDEMQFSHSFFVKDLPETLVFIRRKCTTLKSKLEKSAKEEEIADILTNVKDLKTKHALVDNEIKMLKQENAALWNEVNNLRLKHAKQTKIINKIIHFLISYIHSHQNSLSKSKMAVGTRNTQNLKTGPSILEIGYHNASTSATETNANPYLLSQPGHSGAITYPTETETYPNLQPAEQTLDEILDKVGATINDNEQLGSFSSAQNAGTSNLINVQTNTPGDIKPNLADACFQMKTETLRDNKQNAIQTPVQKGKQIPQNPVKYKILQNPKEHLGSYLNTTQVEIDSLQALLNNLNASQLTNFCSIIEASEMGDDQDDRSDLANICQEMRNDQEVNYENSALQDAEFNQNSLNQFESLPLNEMSVPSSTANEQCRDTQEEEPISQNITIPDLEGEQYTVENFNDIEGEDLVDEYFAI